MTSKSNIDSKEDVGSKPYNIEKELLTTVPIDWQWLNAHKGWNETE